MDVGFESEMSGGVVKSVFDVEIFLMNMKYVGMFKCFRVLVSCFDYIKNYCIFFDFYIVDYCILG